MVAISLRHATPDTVILVGVADAVRRELHALASLGSSIASVETCREAETRLLSIGEACLVVPVPRDPRDPRFEELTRLRSRFPHSTVLALFQPDLSTPDALLALGARGVTEVLVLSGQVSKDAFLSALSRCHRDSLVRRIWSVSDRSLPDPFETLLRVALRHAHEPLTIARMAAICGMHERTLRKHCEFERLPSPQWIVGWARLLLAAYYLEEPGRSFAQVSALLEFPSACALRNQFQRYTRRPTTQLRSLGATRVVFNDMADSVWRLVVPTEQKPPRLTLLRGHT